MFVKANTIREVKQFFNTELSNFYSSNELKYMIKELTIKRFNFSPIEYISSSEIRLSDSDLLFYQDALNRLKQGEPFQYVLGSVWFYDLNLKIDSRALIPRPETEELVDWVKSEMQLVQKSVILDLCSGSGCIALALKSVLTNSEIVAAEYMQDALELIQENKTRTNLEILIESIDVLDGDSYSVFEKASFDCWVSNPPYIPESDKSRMSANVLEHEPDIALFVDDADPLVFYRVIAKNAMLYLKDGGVLFFEIHEDLAKSTEELLKEIGFVNIEVRKDLQGKERMMKAHKVSSRHELK